MNELRVVVQVREIEPGWLIVHFVGNRPPGSQRYHLLDERLHGWLAEHKDRVLQKVSQSSTRANWWG